MHKFVRNLITEWRKLKLPFENETFIVAVSGGADSVSLLIALCELKRAKKLKLNFVCAHFNHDLRGTESLKDAEFVEQLAKKLEVEFIGEIQDPKSKIQDQKGNLEQLARQARYDFLLRAAENRNAYGILTGHTLNDQAETFLLNLIRGSGSLGLGAMTPVRKINKKSKILLIRPFLSWAKREATENFLREREIAFRSDAMNDDEKFSRVAVRKKLIPLLSEFNPKIVETLAQTAKLLRDEAESLSFGVNDLPENPTVNELKDLTKPALYRSLRKWLENLRGDLLGVESKHIEAIERLIYSPKSGRIIELPGGEIIIKKRGKLFFERIKVEKSLSDN